MSVFCVVFSVAGSAGRAPEAHFTHVPHSLRPGLPAPRLPFGWNTPRWMIFDECAKKQKSFHEKLKDAGTMDQLLRMRENYQTGGEDRMAELEKEWLAAQICYRLLSQAIALRFEACAMQSDVRCCLKPAQSDFGFLRKRKRRRSYHRTSTSTL